MEGINNYNGKMVASRILDEVSLIKIIFWITV